MMSYCRIYTCNTVAQKMYNIKCMNVIYIPFAQLNVRGVAVVIGLTEMKSGRHREMNPVPSHALFSLISTFPACVC